MSDKYTADEKIEISQLVIRLFNKFSKMNLSFREMGDLVDAEASSVHRWYHGVSQPSRYHLKRIAHFINKSRK